MQGYQTPYVPGWDNNGLPIEVTVAKEFREKGVKPTPMEMRHRCREVAAMWVENRAPSSSGLGCVAIGRIPI